ncbi:MAG: hypothetical protein ACLU9S_22755 [Oscillospiraceae bacterium]
MIDTGIDADHPSFRSDAFEYGLLVAATREEAARVWRSTALDVENWEGLAALNASKAYDGHDSRLHHSDKIAYGFNHR